MRVYRQICMINRRASRARPSVGRLKLNDDGCVRDESRLQNASSASKLCISETIRGSDSGRGLSEIILYRGCVGIVQSDGK